MRLEDFKIKINPKRMLKGDYAVTDLDKRIIKINKKLHKARKNHPSWVKKNLDGTANLADTLYHETLHIKHPKMSEKKVRQKTAKAMKSMSKSQKSKLYGKFKKTKRK